MTYIEWLASLPEETAEQVGTFYNTPTGQYGGPWDQGGRQQTPYDPNNPYGHINPYAYSGMDREDNPADRLLAQLTRAQLRDYQERFQPAENFLAANITQTGTAQLEADLERTRGSVIQGRDNVRGQSDRFRERYGLSALGASTGAANATASSMVGGLNMTRSRDSDRQNALLTGGLGAIGQNARNIG
jgi:hypothetical protein